MPTPGNACFLSSSNNSSNFLFGASCSGTSIQSVERKPMLPGAKFMDSCTTGFLYVIPALELHIHIAKRRAYVAFSFGPHLKRSIILPGKSCALRLTFPSDALSNVTIGYMFPSSGSIPYCST